MPVNRQALEEQLSKITTLWTVLRQAHEGPVEEAGAARELLIRRYRGAVYRYLLRSTGDPAAADDLTQEFALGLLQGSLRNADPGRGRFRDYVRTALFHLVCRHYRENRKLPRPLPGDHPEWDSLAAPPEDFERQFDQGWRDDLLARAWAALEKARPDWHTLLRCRRDNPKLNSAGIARLLGATAGKSLTDAGIRKTLERARDLLAEFLVAEVAASLQTPTPDAIEEELRALDLLSYCQDALENRAGG